MQAIHIGVSHLYKAHLWQMLAAPALQTQLVLTPANGGDNEDNSLS